MSKEEIVVDPELAQNYARIKGVTLEIAYERLKENFTKEADTVDLRQQYQTLIKAFRQMSPQLTGVVTRESDTALKISQLQSRVGSLEAFNEDLEKRLVFERETFAKALGVLNNIVKEDEKVQTQIRTLTTALEALSVPVHKRIWNKIKWLLKI